MEKVGVKVSTFKLDLYTYLGIYGGNDWGLTAGIFSPARFCEKKAVPLPSLNESIDHAIPLSMAPETSSSSTALSSSAYSGTGRILGEGREGAPSLKRSNEAPPEELSVKRRETDNDDYARALMKSAKEYDNIFAAEKEGDDEQIQRAIKESLSEPVNDQATREDLEMREAIKLSVNEQ